MKHKEFLEENLTILSKMETLINRFPNESFGEIIYKYLTPETTITMGDVLIQSNQTFLDTMDRFLHKKKDK